MTPIIELIGVCKSFGGLRASWDISFSISEGEIVGLIGPNGAGKTTLINLISGNLNPDSGKIIFTGVEIQGLAPDRANQLGIARTYQVVQPFRGMTVIENITTGALFGRCGKGRSVVEAVKRAEEVAELCKIADKKAELVANLTIADVRRLEIAKALATDPFLLLLDEALAGLNPREINESLSLIAEINRMGITILIIEHIMKAVMSVSRRVVVLHHGSVMAVDAPENIVCNEQVITAYLGHKYAERTRRQDEKG